jgi:hypothetical protein
MGAQNLCATVAESAWILLLDADILIPADQIGKILALPRSQRDVAYKFNREKITGKLKVRPGQSFDY